MSTRGSRGFRGPFWLLVALVAPSLSFVAWFWLLAYTLKAKGLV